MKLPWPRALCVVAAVVLLVTSNLHAQEGARKDWAADTFEKTLRPFLQRHCYACHEGRDAEADLVVISTHGRQGLERVFLGSVARRVARDAPVSVLAVPPA